VQGASLLISFSSDWLYPTAGSRAIADALRRQGRPVEHVELTSSVGHDAFLVDDVAQRPILTGFLDELAAAMSRLTTSMLY